MQRTRADIGIRSDKGRTISGLQRAAEKQGASDNLLVTAGNGQPQGRPQPLNNALGASRPEPATDRDQNPAQNRNGRLNLPISRPNREATPRKARSVGSEAPQWRRDSAASNMRVLAIMQSIFRLAARRRPAGSGKACHRAGDRKMGLD